MFEHYVTVLEVTDSQVIVGDPLDGLDKLSYDEFQDKWRFIGITLKRKS
jgi:ABC-type bacteriocin/lantibiotic exporter with double-glycine peptidase domain